MFGLPLNEKTVTLKHIRGQSVVYGYFHNIECADEFMNKLGKLVRAEMECEKNA